ncbi:hypothetical protein F5B20DRAFT_587941 [Whalleya microplaca]|nr:hypothetical protein F5B20DRAFT_587941 [Whalleya microplaca]
MNDTLTSNTTVESRPSDVNSKERRIFFACLFVSYGNGNRNYFSRKPGRDGKKRVRLQTDIALAHLKEAIQREARSAYKEEIKGKGKEGAAPKSMAYRSGWTPWGNDTVIYSHSGNASAFGLKAKDVEALIRQNFVGWKGEWYMLE